MSNCDSTKKLGAYGPGASVGLALSAFLETPTELLIKNSIRVDERGKYKIWWRFPFLYTN